MPSTARVLRFPAKAQRATLSAAGARQLAERFLSTPIDERPRELVLECLREPDAILAICERLRELRDSMPAATADEAGKLYFSITQSGRPIGFFDESHYFVGDLALLAGGAYRLLGKRDDAELWLDRAEAAFRHTVNPAPALAAVSYERLTIQHDKGLYERVLELVPSLIESFNKMGMRRESLKARLAQMMSFKGAKRDHEAQAVLEAMREDPSLKDEPALHGLVLVNLAEFWSATGLFGDAIGLCNEALPLLQASNKPFMVAYMKSVVGECLRHQGNLMGAVTAYKEAIHGYAALGMTTWVAYLRVIAAESLIALNRSREAEWELLAALPTIEEQKMVPEGFAAVALLTESVRRRKTDPNALRELREHLQANK